MNKILMGLLSAVLWFGVIGCYALPNALDTSHVNGIAITEQRNADADYQESEQYRQARHANQFLAKNRSK